MLFLWLKFDRPLAFFEGHWVAGWGAEQTWSSFVQMMKAISNPVLMAGGHFEESPRSSTSCSRSVLLAALAFNARRIGLIPAVWSLVTLFISLRVWKASGRYAAVVFPCFIGLALFTESRPLLFQWLLTFFAVLLSLLTYWFSHGYFVS